MFYWYSNWACKTHNRTPYTSQALFPVVYLLQFISNPHKANSDVCKERQCECINTENGYSWNNTLSLLEFTCVCSFYIPRWIATKAILEGGGRKCGSTLWRQIPCRVKRITPGCRRQDSWRDETLQVMAGHNCSMRRRTQKLREVAKFTKLPKSSKQGGGFALSGISQPWNNSPTLNPKLLMTCASGLDVQLQLLLFFFFDSDSGWNSWDTCWWCYLAAWIKHDLWLLMNILQLIKWELGLSLWHQI